MARGSGKLVAAIGIGGGFLLATGIALASTMTSKKGGGTRVRRMSENIPMVKALVSEYAPKMGVPSSLVMTILGIESGYNPQAVNWNDRAKPKGGAWGLGQMTLDTARDLTARYPEVSKKYWPAWNGTGPGLTNPRVNVAMACFLLSLAWRKYASKSNRWLTTGVSYHQGMGTIDKLLAAHGKITVDVLPPFGRQYYTMLMEEHATNPAIVAMYNAETSAGAKYV